MKTFVSLLLTAGLALASPVESMRRAGRGGVMIPHDKNSLRPDVAPGNATGATEDSDNWSGFGFTSAPSTGKWTSVTGTFTIPTPNPPTSGSGTWYGCAWVGIDGNTVQSALFQGGVDWSVTRSSGGSLSRSYSLWIEWIPRSQTTVSGLSVTAGDSITVTCTATSTTTGTCKYVNNSTGKSVSATTNAPSSSAALKGQNVEWIVEDFTIGSGLAPFANYGSVPFSSCSATAGGTTYGISGAEQIVLESSSGAVESTCSESSSSAFTCTYE